MLALAHTIQDSIDRGVVAHQAEVTQLLGLTLLPPEIQEAILFSEAVDGVEPWTERGLREVVWSGDWGVQRRVWRTLDMVVEAVPAS